MNKKMKASLIIVGIVILLLLILFSLIYFKVMYNPFINNRDLVCSRVVVDSKEEINFKFNWLGKSIFSKKKDYIYFETTEAAQEYYDYYKDVIMSNISVTDKTIILDSDVENEKENYGESRKEIIKKYTDYGYECN